MRFCPFCAHENVDDTQECAKCGKRLPPPRRATEAEQKPAPTALPSVPKPNVASRPQTLAPKSPLRSRPEAAAFTAAAKAPTVSAPAISAPEAAPRPPAPNPTAALLPERPTSRPPTTSPPKGALPLPPPPSDYHEPMQTPTVLRDLTGHAPAVAAGPALHEDARDGHSQGPPGVPVLSSLPEDVIDTAPQKTLGLFDRARMSGERALRTAQRVFDVGAARYAVGYVRDMIKKRSEIGRIRKQVVAEQQKLDGVLKQLGQAARAADLGLPALVLEMRVVKTLESDCETARTQIQGEEKKRQEEEERFRAVEREQQAAIGQADDIVLKLSEELAQKSSERAGHRAGVNRLEAQLKSLQRTAETREADAARAEDPTQQATLRGQLSATRSQIAELEPERDKLAQKAQELDAPIAELEGKVAAAQEDASRLRRDFGVAARTHQDLLGQLDLKIAGERSKITNNERELSLKFVTLGTILNLNRVGGADFEPHYQTFDAIKAIISGCEERIVALEGEIQNVDRGKFRKGSIVLGSGLFVLFVIIWIVAR